jgi:ABC-type multidrug transport system fused ATPase/permease subunit
MAALQMQNMPRHDPVPPRRPAQPAEPSPDGESDVAWRRYKALMSWMALASVLAVLAALAWLWATGTEMRLGAIIATIGGVGLSVLLGTALMGLTFFSNRGGHDDAAASWEREP